MSATDQYITGETSRKMTKQSEDPQTIRLAELAKVGAQVVPGRRASDRKTLLSLPNGRIVRGHMETMSLHRITVSTSNSLEIDAECSVFVTLQAGEETLAIIGKGIVTHCGGSGQFGYLVEMDLIVDDKKSRIIMEQLFGTKPSVHIR
jgi:hypothetical protein